MVDIYYMHNADDIIICEKKNIGKIFGENQKRDKMKIIWNI